MKFFVKIIYSKNKARLIIELILLFVLFPIFLAYYKMKIPLMLVLVFFGILIFLFLRFDTSFDKKQFANWKSGKHILKEVFLIFTAAAIIMIVLIYLIDSSRLFFLAKKIPWLLVLISIFYPLFSVLPQTLIYRLFFFHRYDSLFKNETLKIILSGLFFSLGHLLYKNVLVLGLAFIAGIIFAYHFNKSKSLTLSFFEHSLYGVWLFTSGLGYFFVSQFVK